jgi:2,4-dienoyl-CoA reductase-like NADH-dependent reductase (Old Yellow Enzyme family)/thioredoxin reductase
VPTLSDPIRLGEKLKLKNRLVNAPMYRCFGIEDGYVRQDYVDSYAAEARGGPAMVIVANTAVSKSGIAFRRLPRIDEDRFVAGVADLAYAIHLADCKAAIQLFHGGIICRPDCLGGERPVSPSELPLPFAPATRSRALGDAEIEQIIEDFGVAARRAMEAGFDAIDVHACHGGLPHQFVSPLFNKREDKWGVDKLLFAKRVIKSIRNHTHPDFPIIWRFSAEEYTGIEGYDFAYTLEQAVPAFIEAGADCLDVSTGGVTSNEGLAYLTPPVYFRPGILLDYAAAVKERTRLPVMAVGKLSEPKLVEEVVASGRADLVALGREIFADPEFPRKVLAGRYDDVRRCLSCNWCLATAFFRNETAKCAVNAGLGHEREYYAFRAPARRKRVLVAGGGPGGMEFARVAAERGHEVTLYEKADRLGGLVKLASAFPHLRTRELRNIIVYLRHEMERLGVRVHLNREVTPHLVEQERPDVVVVATGSIANWPAIDGVQNPIVHQYEEYLAGTAELGERVVVIGGVEGAEVALSLARQKKTVTLVEKTDDIAKAPYLLDPARVQMLTQEYLPQEGVRLRLRRKVTEIDGGSVRIIDKHGAEEVLPADSVVLACGRLPNEFLKEALQGKVPELYAIGDCLKQRSIGAAVHEASFWARQI